MALEKRIVTLADWDVTEYQAALIGKSLLSGRLTYGPMHRQLEKKFARLHKKKYCIFTNSGTSALQVSLHFLKDKYGWNDGDEVLVPATTFVATINVVLMNNLKPVLVDVDPFTFDMDISKISEKITSKTRAIMPVSLLGQPYPTPLIKDLVEKHGLFIVEDNCETMFVKYDKKPVGYHSDIACYSSYLAHIISTGVGGFIVTDDKEWADTMRSMIWHGRDNKYLSMDDNNNEDKKELMHARFKFNRLGYSYRATEIEAALGIGELRRHKKILRLRKRNAKYLTKKLKPFEDKLQLPTVRPKSGHAWIFYPLVVTDVDRDKFALFLEENGVGTRWLMPLTNQPVYEGWLDEDDYPVAKMLNNQGLLIGIHQYLSREDLDYVVQVIKDYFE